VADVGLRYAPSSRAGEEEEGLISNIFKGIVVLSMKTSLMLRLDRQ